MAITMAKEREAVTVVAEKYVLKSHFSYEQMHY